MPLSEYFAETCASDAFDYGYGAVRDFLAEPYDDASFDWVITNPPFRLAAAFVLRALRVARHGVAILERTVFLESVGRFEVLFQKNPSTKFAPFVERVPMVKGRLDQRATTATAYAWFIWEKENPGEPRLMWVPPCRKYLERPRDYDLPRRPHRDATTKRTVLLGELPGLTIE